MRYLRILFVVVLALALLTVSLANRGMVSVSLLPGQLAAYAGHSWSARMPLFLVIMMALLVGIVVGLVWEWLREAQLRRESGRTAAALTRLEREVGSLRTQHAAPRDEVLAILDAPKAAPGTAVTLSAPAGSAPARR